MNSSYCNEIGRTLKNAREDLHITLPQASAALHIRAHYLHALETGVLTDLPGSAYTKGYLQSYAIFLHLDKDEMLRRFDLIGRDFPERGLFFPQVFSKDKKPSNPIIWGGILLIIILYIVWFLMFRPSFAPITVTPLPYYKTGEAKFPFSNYEFNLACATTQVRVYPACYRADMNKLVGDSPLFLRRHRVSVMELAE